MDDLNVLKKYIGEKIKSIEENNKLIEQKQEQVAKLEKIYSPLISGNYANIDKNYLRDCFDFIFEEDLPLTSVGKVDYKKVEKMRIKKLEESTK